MSSLSCSPAPFGDHEPQSEIQDATLFLNESLRLIRIEAGPKVALMAAEALGILSDNDSMERQHLEAAITESLETRLMDRGPIGRALRELVKRSVLVEDGLRLSLNPAVAALIGRDAA